MTTALAIVTSAYERCNRLSPGEVLSADDAAFGLRRLNELVDEMSAKRLFLYRAVTTSAAQTGNVTLGAGSWAAIAPGSDVISATCNNLPLLPITMQQYNELQSPAVSGAPAVWAQDGLSTVYLSPAPTGHTIKLLTRVGVSAFADQTTDYTMPAGYQAALSAGLAVRIAPNVIGQLPAHLVRAERIAMDAINNYEPAIVGTDSFTGRRAAYPSRLFS